MHPNPAPRALCALPALLLLLAAGGAAARSFSDTAPGGVDLGGDWQLDAAASDDLRAVLEAQRPKPGRRPERSGGPQEGAPDGQAEGQQDPLPEPGEPRRQRQGPGQGPRAGDARAGREDSPVGRSPFQLRELLRLPERLHITQTAAGLTLQSEDGTDEFEAGGESIVSFGRSGAERRTGWHGREFVVETRAESGPTQSRSYALDPAGRLHVITRLSGQRVPKLTFRSVYRRAGPAEPGSAASRVPAT